MLPPLLPVQTKDALGGVSAAIHGRQLSLTVLVEEAVQFVLVVKCWLVSTTWQQVTQNLLRKQMVGTQQHLLPIRVRKLGGDANKATHGKPQLLAVHLGVDVQFVLTN